MSVSITDFGAKSGAADSTAAFNQAVYGQQEIRVPAGLWNITGLTWRSDNISLIGEGPGASVIRINRSSTAPTRAIRMVAGNVALKHLTLQEANPPANRGQYNVPGMAGITLGGEPRSSGNLYCDRVTVENVQCSSIVGQVIVGYYASHVRITDCDIKGGSDGIAVENCLEEAIVSRNTVRGTSDDLLIVKAASDNGGTTTKKVIVTDNIVSEGDAEGIEIAGCEYFVCTGNIIGPVNQHSLAVYADWAFPNLLPPRYGVVDNNVIYGAGKWFGTDTRKYLYTAPNPSAGPLIVSAPNVTIGTNPIYDSLGIPVYG